MGYSVNQESLGKGNTTNSATSGQPQMCQPNQNVPAAYTNTVSQWDNPQSPSVQSNPSSENQGFNQSVGKGKGG